MPTKGLIITRTTAVRIALPTNSQKTVWNWKKIFFIMGMPINNAITSPTPKRSMILFCRLIFFLLRLFNCSNEIPPTQSL